MYLHSVTTETIAHFYHLEEKDIEEIIDYMNEIYN